MDAVYAREMYELYQEQFLINRLGISMFREYPMRSSLGADVDSGPIIWGAGVTATGVGLAASLANGDLQTGEDIYGLAAGLGLKWNTTHEDHTGTHYLFGVVPVGHAFLTWAHTLPVPNLPISSERSTGARLWARRSFIVVLLAYPLIAFLFALWCFLRARRRYRIGGSRNLTASS